MSQINPNLSQLNPDLSQLNPNLSQLNPNLSQLNPNLTQLHPNLSQLNPMSLVGLPSEDLIPIAKLSDDIRKFLIENPSAEAELTARVGDLMKRAKKRLNGFKQKLEVGQHCDIYQDWKKPQNWYNKIKRSSIYKYIQSWMYIYVHLCIYTIALDLAQTFLSNHLLTQFIPT